MNATVYEVEASCVNAHGRGGTLPVVGAAPALAEETAGAEPAGEAEKAAAVKSEALVPWAQDKAERGLYEKASSHMSGHPRRYHRGESAKSRRRRERLSESSRRYRKMARTGPSHCR